MFQVYEVEPGRWGYRVDSVVQEWHPDLPGFVPMSQAEASELAIRQLDRLSDSSRSESDPGITKLAFMEKFTDAELVTIYSAARVNAQVEVWLEKLKMTTGNVFLTDPRTIAGVYGLERAGLIGKGRAMEIIG